jgi:hypothetical protein
LIRRIRTEEWLSGSGGREGEGGEGESYLFKEERRGGEEGREKKWFKGREELARGREKEGRTEGRRGAGWKDVWDGDKRESNGERVTVTEDANNGGIGKAGIATRSAQQKRFARPAEELPLPAAEEGLSCGCPNHVATPSESGLETPLLHKGGAANGCRMLAARRMWNISSDQGEYCEQRCANRLLRVPRLAIDVVNGSGDSFPVHVRLKDVPYVGEGMYIHLHLPFCDSE